MEYVQQLNTFVSGGVPSYGKTFNDIKWGVEYCLANCSGDFQPLTFFRTFERFAVLDNIGNEFGVVIALAIFWTLLRYLLSFFIFEPIAKLAKLRQPDAAKYPESAWKFIVYTITLSLSCYIIFGLPQYNHIFYEPDSIWNDHVPGMRVEPVISWAYALQISFYIHSIYASLCMDAWRSDSNLMIFHHFLAISLIGFSYLTRYHKIGLLVLFIHDPTDVVLEFTKCNVYFKTRGGLLYRLHDILSTIGFITFALFWFVLRLYWMPLKILHSAGYGSMVRYSETGHLPFYFFFNTMLWVLQLINAYWFLYIVSFLVKVVTGQISEVDDIREEEVIQRNLDMATAKDNGHHQCHEVEGKKQA
ncbi:ceramide synthase 1-like isoform X2 [Watersipora subatra]|uniref:ceramide synthase 1-like isoform X2 n=1 Tax=Watersipora subatra TaxID=2589382 RepID=UPI00355B8567